MLEHPEISWIERTGYPSWLQETGMESPQVMERRKENVKICVPMGVGLLTAARAHQQLRKKPLPPPTQDDRKNPDLPPG